MHTFDAVDLDDDLDWDEADAVWSTIEDHDWDIANLRQAAVRLAQVVEAIITSGDLTAAGDQLTVAFALLGRDPGTRREL